MLRPNINTRTGGTTRCARMNEVGALRLDELPYQTGNG